MVILLLIVFEGLHGCGKSTQLEKLKCWFEDQYNTSVVTTSWNSYPGLNELNGDLKDMNKITPMSSCLIHSLDFTLRYEQIVQPALIEKKIVLSDRYIYTAYVRDSLRGISINMLDELYGQAIKPDLIIFLDISAAHAVERLKDINQRSNYVLGTDLNFDKDKRKNFIKFLDKQRDLYKNILISKGNLLIVDASMDSDVLFQKIINHITSLKLEGGKYDKYRKRI